MQPDPHRLLVLRAVRRTGSMQAAAAALHLTPSGVSQHLSRLESETGLELLDRSHRGGGRSVRLTGAGVALAERADGVAAALAEAEREIALLRDGSAGVVRIGGFSSALSRLLAVSSGPISRKVRGLSRITSRTQVPSTRVAS